MTIDHIAIAVRSIDQAAVRLGTLFGYRPRTAKVTNTRQKVNVVFLSKPASIDLKLIEPSDADSPLWESIRKGGGLHHLCFRVADVVAASEAMTAAGARQLTAAAPGEAFDDGLIAFFYAGAGLNVELIDTDNRRDVISDGDVAFRE